MLNTNRTLPPIEQLLAYKDDAQYASKTMGASSAKAAVRQAADLVGAAKSHP
jgi:hypothetical protein